MPRGPPNGPKPPEGIGLSVSRGIRRSASIPTASSASCAHGVGEIRPFVVGCPRDVERLVARLQLRDEVLAILHRALGVDRFELERQVEGGDGDRVRQPLAPVDREEVDARRAERRERCLRRDLLDDVGEVQLVDQGMRRDLGDVLARDRAHALRRQRVGICAAPGAEQVDEVRPARAGLPRRDRQQRGDQLRVHVRHAVGTETKPRAGTRGDHDDRGVRRELAQHAHDRRQAARARPTPQPGGHYENRRLVRASPHALPRRTAALPRAAGAGPGAAPAP